MGRAKPAKVILPKGDTVTIVFGSNATDHRVLMYFPPPVAVQVVFSAADARDTAKKLAHYADIADGKKGM